MEETAVQQQQDKSSSSVAIALLDLPQGSMVSINGNGIRLQRDDFVGIQQIPSDKNVKLNLVVIRAAAATNEEEQGGMTSVSVGFIIPPPSPKKKDTASQFTLVRRYDPQTEEVSSDPVEEATIVNLQAQLDNQQIEPQRIPPYTSLVSNDQDASWKSLTHWISPWLLQQRHIPPGTKIVPGAYAEDEEDGDDFFADLSSSHNNSSQRRQQQQQPQESVDDGVSIHYPAIPVLYLNQQSSFASHHSHHEGTRSYLASLPPSDRTHLFLQSNSHDYVMEDILGREYQDGEWSHLLGDVQLAFIMFLHLQCFSSMEHWRDLVAMLCHVSVECMEHYVELYQNLLQILGRQVTSIEEDFFQDMDISGDNFLLPALNAICQTSSHLGNHVSVQQARTELCQILENRFPDTFHPNPPVNNDKPPTEISPMVFEDSDEEDDDDDMPVVVSNEEIEASMARTAASQSTSATTSRQAGEYSKEMQQNYPILFAAKQDHEDVLMTCARALDEKNDVSLVREASAFLENEIDQQHQSTGGQ